MQIIYIFLHQKFTEIGQIARLRKAMTPFKNLLNFDKLLKRKFCGILSILEELQNMTTIVTFMVHQNA